MNRSHNQELAENFCRERQEHKLINPHLPLVRSGWIARNSHSRGPTCYEPVKGRRMGQIFAVELSFCKKLKYFLSSASAGKLLSYFNLFSPCARQRTALRVNEKSKAVISLSLSFCCGHKGCVFVQVTLFSLLHAFFKNFSLGKTNPGKPLACPPFCAPWGEPAPVCLLNTNTCSLTPQYGA